jgi:hypothetical protein
MYQHTFNISANGDTSTEASPGEHAVTVAGDWGGGTISIQWKDSAGNSVEFPSGSLTENGGLVVASCTPYINISLSGATNPDLTATISKL